MNNDTTINNGTSEWQPRVVSAPFLPGDIGNVTRIDDVEESNLSLTRGTETGEKSLEWLSSSIEHARMMDDMNFNNEIYGTAMPNDAKNEDRQTELLTLDIENTTRIDDANSEGGSSRSTESNDTSTDGSAESLSKNVGSASTMEELDELEVDDETSLTTENNATARDGPQEWPPPDLDLGRAAMIDDFEDELDMSSMFLGNDDVDDEVLQSNARFFYSIWLVVRYADVLTDLWAGDPWHSLQETNTPTTIDVLIEGPPSPPFEERVNIVARMMQQGAHDDLHCHGTVSCIVRLIHRVFGLRFLAEKAYNKLSGDGVTFFRLQDHTTGSFVQATREETIDYLLCKFQQLNDITPGMNGGVDDVPDVDDTHDEDGDSSDSSTENENESDNDSEGDDDEWEEDLDVEFDLSDGDDEEIILNFDGLGLTDDFSL